MTVNSGSAFAGSFYNPAISGQTYINLGQGATTGDSCSIGFSRAGANSPSNSFDISFWARGSSASTFKMYNSNSTAAELNCPLTVSGAITAPSLALSTPLPVTSGGTGTAAIGSPGQYAIVNAGANGYSFTTGPGGGGVTSVGLSTNTAFNNFATITSSTSNPITNTGILTINMVAAPIITGFKFEIIKRKYNYCFWKPDSK